MLSDCTKMFYSIEFRHQPTPPFKNISRDLDSLSLFSFSPLVLFANMPQGFENQKAKSCQVPEIRWDKGFIISLYTHRYINSICTRSLSLFCDLLTYSLIS